MPSDILDDAENVSPGAYYTKKLHVLAPQRVIPETGYEAGVSADLAEFRKREQKYNKESILTTIGASLQTGQGLVPAVIAKASRVFVEPDFPAEKGYEAPVNILFGKDEWEIDELKQSRSAAETQHLLMMQSYTKEQEQLAASRGPVTGFVSALIADAPGQIAFGKGVGSMMSALKLGSAGAAAAGNLGQAVRYSALEQAVAGVGASLTEDALTNRVSAAQYALDLVGGVVLGVPMEYHGLAKTARGVRAANDLLLDAERAIRAKQGFDAQASKLLGEGASPEDVAKKATELEQAWLIERQAQATSQKDSLFPDIDKLTAEELAREAENLTDELAPIITNAVGDADWKASLKQWFGGSVLVDEAGNPLTMYHGTTTDVEAFSLTPAGRNLGTKELIFFSPDVKTAETYANARGGNEGANIMPVYVKVELPFDPSKLEHVEVIRDEVLRSADAMDELEIALGQELADPSELVARIKGGDTAALQEALTTLKNNWGVLETPEIVSHIKASGFDGVFVRENGIRNVGVFDPKQIKSTLNDGTFDPTTAKISRDGVEVTTADRHPGADAMDQRLLNELAAKGTAGLLVHPSVSNRPELIAATESLLKDFLPGARMVLIMDVDLPANVKGELYTSPKASGEFSFILRLNPRFGEPKSQLITIAHEVGHAIDFALFHRAPREIREGVRRAVQRFRDSDALGDYLEANRIRRSLSSYDEGGGDPSKATRWSPEYNADMREVMAEQFARFIEEDLYTGAGKTSLDPSWQAVIRQWLNKIIGVFETVMNLISPKDGWVGPEAEMKEFFESIQKGLTTEAAPWADRTGPTAMNPAAPAAPQRPKIKKPRAPDTSFLQDPIAIKYGLGMLPVDTPAARAEARAIIETYRKADNPNAIWNNLDPARVKTLLASVDWAASTGIRMLNSDNPVMRMIAAELLETTTGAAGRKPTAAISKYLHEGRILGNVIPDFHRVYDQYAKAAGAGKWQAYAKGDLWQQFNREVAVEVERRYALRRGTGTAMAEPSVHIKVAADLLEGAYDRARVLQLQAKVTGYANLPDTSVGYMPHSMSPSAVLNMPNHQKEAIWSALVDQFQTVEGWDASFSANLASKYLQRVERRAQGGYESQIGHHHTGAADIVSDALRAMGMPEDEVRAQMARYLKGGAGYTKSRLQLDLLKEYPNPDGSTFRLLDVFETDHMMLLRQQAQRASGEAALAEYGVMGRPGLKILREAVTGKGADNGKATLPELDAFDQVAAEFLGDPFGNVGGKWMNRAIQFNSLARLGGMGFTQAAETIQIAMHLGVTNALSMIGGFRRLRGEAVALAKGENVDNGLLRSLELYGGRDFGTDAYKMVFPFEDPQAQYAVAGAPPMEVTDRLLRGGLQAQAKLSFWRAVTSAQHRGVAEQIVLKALRFIREGKDDIALADMGFTPEVTAAVKAQYDTLVKLDANGRVQSFDITKMEGPEAAAFVQAVHRGTNQIIQGTFIGESGKWAHDGWLRLLAQFRTFGLVAIEKQWARTRANHGLAATLGYLIGGMAAASPIHMARVYVQSVGRPDQDEYLERRLAPWAIARASLNYVSLAGFGGDVLDGLGSFTGAASSGGRMGGGTDFFGSAVAPAIGLADSVYGALQNTKPGTDFYGVASNLPFSKLPYLVPLVNMTKGE